MSRNTIRFVTVLATLSIVGLSIIQIYWAKKVYSLKESEFNLSVSNALLKVSERLCKCEKSTLPANHPVDQLSSNYFVVNVNDMIDPVYLDFYLRDELSKRNVITDFEYGIYDCTSQDMVYTNFVQFDGTPNPELATSTFPTLNSETYYFGVYFPHKYGMLVSQMGIWVFLTGVMGLVIIFFGYTLFVILKQKRLSEIQRDFINNMTHEFKTPISTIAISSEVLRNPDITQNPSRLLNYATIIQNEANRLRQQVERVLQMATLEKEDLGLKKEKVDVHEIINKAISSLEVPLADRNGVVEKELYAQPSEIIADPLHLTNIIYNLIDNSIKYCNENPKIIVSTKNEKGKFVIEVGDNGIGITPEHQKKVFHKFFRVPTGNIHDVKGFGLGLNYVRIMVKAHEGEIKLQSEVNKGTRFKLSFPLA